MLNRTPHLGCSLAELAECADVLTFGGTKNGAMGAEALIVMGGGLSADVPYLRKQQTQLTSKMRFVAAQFGALMQGDLWRDNAIHAMGGLTYACHPLDRRRSNFTPERLVELAPRFDIIETHNAWAGPAANQAASVRWKPARPTARSI